MLGDIGIQTSCGKFPPIIPAQRYAASGGEFHCPGQVLFEEAQNCNSNSFISLLTVLVIVLFALAAKNALLFTQQTA